MLFAIMLALVASCGGGVDSGGTGAPPTSYASGPITGFGSVIVNGVHFDEHSATVTDAEGNPHTSADLQLGMSTEVRGSTITVDASGNNVSTASSIVFASQILGPLTASNPVARTLGALGQSIDVSASTAFDATLTGGQSALAVGDIVAIYATFDAASGRYSATRVERNTGAQGYSLRGVVSAFDGTAKTLSIGAAHISFAGVAAAQLPAGLGNGSLVRVSLAPVPVGGYWQATAVVDGVQTIADHDAVTIKDRISAFTSAQQFSVDGTPVDARTAIFPAGMVGLKLGARVEVDGSTSAGVLVATSVTVITDDEDDNQSLEVEGKITALDSIGQTFVVRNVTVSYSGTVTFENGSAANLAVGKAVEVHGVLSPDGTRLQAKQIEFDD
jgi:hypothetical protein